MATMMVQQKVKNYSEWRKVFDSVADKRAALGAVGSAKVYRDVDDPNKVIILGVWKSTEQARQWANSSELKAAVQKTEIIEPPVFTFLNEA
jgi:heme-degrading monooxygenase HmoA